MRPSLSIIKKKGVLLILYCTYLSSLIIWKYHAEIICICHICCKLLICLVQYTHDPSIINCSEFTRGRLNIYTMPMATIWCRIFNTLDKRSGCGRPLWGLDVPDKRSFLSLTFPILDNYYLSICLSDSITHKKEKRHGDMFILMQTTQQYYCSNNFCLPNSPWMSINVCFS